MIQNVVSKLASGMGKTRPLPIYSFLFHLYQKLELLREEEMVAYNVAKVMLKNFITSKLEPKAKERTDSKRKSLDPEEIE